MGDVDGRIELILGNMYSGKTTELIRKIGRYRAAGKPAQMFKPSLDNRFGIVDRVVSHDQAQTEAYPVQDIGKLEESLQPQTTVIGIDEAQFFPDQLIEFCRKKADAGRIVVVAALYHEFRGQPFPFRDSQKTVYDLAAIADHTKVLTALCTYKGNGTICGQDAAWVQRYINHKIAPANSPTIMVGAQESYATRCRQHFVRLEGY